MLPDADYKPVLSVSIPPDQRQPFYTSLAQFRQRYPFTTNSGLVVQAVIASTQMEQQLIELFAQLPQPVQITQQGSVYLWQCATGQGSALTFLEATRQALTTLLGPVPSPDEDQPASPTGTQEQVNSEESANSA
ncbi:MAG: hypothetical protein NVSMB27_28460 [Ktedonobacteraceae bacterium]